MVRLWRDQGKPDEARDLHAPVHGLSAHWGNPHPAARAEHDWKVAASEYLMPARKCSVFRDTKTRIRTEPLRTQISIAREAEFLGQRQTARKGAGAQGVALGRQNLLAEPRRFGASRRVPANLR